MKAKYMDRALRSRDPRYARVLTRLGYDRRDMRAVEQVDDLAALRVEYERIVGRKPFNGWSAETLAEKIASHRAAQDED